MLGTKKRTLNMKLDLAIVQVIRSVIFVAEDYKN